MAKFNPPGGRGFNSPPLGAFKIFRLIPRRLRRGCSLGLTARFEEKVPDVFYSDAIIDYAYAHYKNMLPLHRWLRRI